MYSLKKVAILGASDKPDRYAYKALKMLIEKSYQVFPINPSLQTIEGIKCYHNISDINETIHTLTIYMNPQRWGQLITDIIKLSPQRVVCNPGTESEEMEEKLIESGINCLEACTLVLLRTNRF